MNILDIIAKKRDSKELTKQEIEYFVKEYTVGNITDYQAAALIMAIYIKGMNDREITDLTLAMAHSGEVLDLSCFGENVVDKHSTGGVGDKVSIILLPIIASLGVPVAKMSGRGLGFTGGTVDKMESIPGYKTNISIKDFIEDVKKVGISMIGQTMNLAPADKKIYALRDAISCVENIPLIASSIMSKKIASGANKIVIDVTVGKGAFMKNKEDAQKLAEQMIRIGKLAGREVRCVLTPMDEPLGYAVGNSLEVIEAINFLKGNMPKDLKDVVLELGANMLQLAGKGENIEENKLKMLKNIENGAAFNKFEEMVKNQGGDISYLEDTTKFKKSKYTIAVVAEEDGIVKEINAEEIGKLACYLGAGRVNKDDKIEPDVGIVLNKKVGDEVMVNDFLAYICGNDENKVHESEKKILEIYKIS
ncbi:pyrimidine-nucleoside phosphorylase [Clostridium sp. CAG:356]|jgi:pyrimidine-nucleoside phosphorylase|nr:MAG: pyrimidine-nucleoside phosphorylase [Clostridium sp. 28_12]CDD37779.1 pyrimidine-nucleoside phosphorylase [Clostridium sp. CAG:356]